MLKFTVPLLTFLTFSVAHSAPSILSVSGSLEAEKQIIISGVGFGSTGPNVVLFDDFSENIEEGAQFSTTAKIGVWAQMRARKFSDSTLSNGQGGRLIIDTGHIINSFLFPAPASEVFISSYAYVPSGYKFPAANEFETMPSVSSLKHHWFYYGSGGYAGGAGHDNFGPNWTGSGWHKITSNESKTYVYQQWGSPGWEWGKPVRWSHWLKGNGMNTEGTEGAFQGVTSTGQVNEIYNQSNMEGKVWFTPDYEGGGMPYAWDRLSLVGYFANGSSYPTHNYVIDDVYLATGPNSAARVEIGNNATYSSCTKLAIQTPTSWADGSITVDLRKGGFADGATVYIFVVDKDNVPSTGYQVTLPGGTPTITGATVGSNSISITGSGFGMKSTAAPIRFDNFEGLTVGNNVSSETGWWQDSTSVTNRLKVSDTYAHGGSKSAIAAQTTEQAMGGSNPQIHRSGLTSLSDSKKVLVSMWVRWHWPDWANGDPANSPSNEMALQYKLFRVASDIEDSGNVIYPHVAYFPWKDYGGIGIDRTLIGSNSTTLGVQNNSLVNNQWHHITLLVDQGTAGNSNGKIISYISKPGTTYITTQSADNVNIIGSAENYIDSVKLDNYIDYNNDTIVAQGATVSQTGIYFDDIYIDNTFQRVELCDASTKATSTKCELQIPTSWSDTGVEVTINKGSFADGATAYLIAYNGTNVASTSYQVTLPVAGPSISSVTGSVTNGQTLTILGSGFGTHADHNTSRTYLAAGWENFESGTADSIFNANYGPELVVGGSLQKNNSNYSAKGYYWGSPRAYTDVWGRAQNAATMYGFHLPLSSLQKKIFISGWFMFPEGFDTGIRYDTSMVDQTKFLCMTPRGTLGGSDGSKTYFQTRKGNTIIPLRTETEDGYLSEGDQDPLFNYSPMGTWHRFDIYVDLTKPDGQKIHNWYVDGKKVPRTHPYYNNDAELTSAGIINGFNYLSWLMFQFQGSDNPTWPQYMDDAFANLTQARVEISESATWSEAVQTNKNIQIPTSWSDTSISATVNLGNFDTSSPLYLYVIHDDGSVSPAYQIRGAGGGGTPGPSLKRAGGGVWRLNNGSVLKTP